MKIVSSNSGILPDLCDYRSFSCARMEGFRENQPHTLRKLIVFIPVLDGMVPRSSEKQDVATAETLGLEARAAKTVAENPR